MTTKKQKVGNVPNLRFPGFEDEWKSKKIKDLLKIGSGKDYKHLQKGDVPVYGTGGYMTSVNQYLHNGETVCIGRKGTINKPFYHKGKIWTVDTLFFTHSFNGLTARFGFNIFEKINWLQYNEASGVPSLSKSTIENIEVDIPNEEEQIKIATFLEKIEERIATQNKIIENLESLIKSLEEKFFNKELVFKDSKGKSFSDWQLKKLGEIGQTYNGLSGKTKEDFGVGKSYIQYKQIFDSSKIHIEGCGLVNVLEDETQNKVKYGDVFFTVSSETPDEIGMSSVLLNEVTELYLNSFCFGYRPNSLNIINPKYARYYFRSKDFRGKITKLAQGSTRYNMSKTELMKLEIQLPSLEEQIQISETLSAIDDKIQISKDVLKKYMEQKKYLLMNLFI